MLNIQLPTLDDLQSMFASGTLTEPRQLTDAEREQANANRRAKFDVGYESERRGKGWLERYFNAEVIKNPLREVNTRKGPMMVSSDVDFTMYRPIDGLTKITKIEIKGTVTDSFPLSRISPRERSFLSRSMKFNYDTWLLCMWWSRSNGSRPDCDLMHLFTWQDWLRIEAELQTKITGNFKGKSIRRKIDLKHWDRYAICKDGQRWTLNPNHWLLNPLS